MPKNFAKYIFLLIHGSWHDGRAWGAVCDHLVQNGHVAHAPTLAGHGPNADKSVGHEDCVQSVVDYIETHDLTDFILVGHSFGGTIIQRVAERLPDRVRRLVFCNAFVLRDQESLADNLPLLASEMFEQLAQPDGAVALPFNLFREALFNDGDLAEAQEAYRMLSPTPRRSQTDKLSLPNFFSLSIPKSYVNCTEDIALPPGPDDGWHPHHSSRLGLYRLIQIPGSHEVMFTNPALFADAIFRAGRD